MNCINSPSQKRGRQLLHFDTIKRPVTSMTVQYLQLTLSVSRVRKVLLKLFRSSNRFAATCNKRNTPPWTKHQVNLLRKETRCYRQLFVAIQPQWCAKSVPLLLGGNWMCWHLERLSSRIIEEYLSEMMKSSVGTQINGSVLSLSPCFSQTPVNTMFCYFQLIFQKMHKQNSHTGCPSNRYNWGRNKKNVSYLRQWTLLSTCSSFRLFHTHENT